MYGIGYDIGSSSVKASLIDVRDRRRIGSVQHPEIEMEIMSIQAGWAEQDPETWWTALCAATKLLLKDTGVDPSQVQSIGIAYQMHGLVLVDSNQQVLRPSIIWCDSRAVDIGEKAFNSIGTQYCLDHLLNSPGNFTGSRLKWVMDNEPEIYAKVHKIMLPGDYIAMKLTGEIQTTIPGLSEAMLWDYQQNSVASRVLEHFGLDQSMIPDRIGTFELQGRLTRRAAAATGLKEGTVLTYRAGDQPNNALALGVLNPNEVAATGGTSGVVYGVVDQLSYDRQSRVNGFAHVNHTHENPRIGLLLCINGAGIQYAWMKQQVAIQRCSYQDMEEMARAIPIGSEGLQIMPFGNGAERMLGNVNPGAQINNLHFNMHTRAHLFRASLEGIAFSFVYGFQVMRNLGLMPKVIKVGNDNLFRSEIFGSTIANLLDCSIEVYNTTGAIGAAQASTVYTSGSDITSIATGGLLEKTYVPVPSNARYKEIYRAWEGDLEALLHEHNHHR